MGGNVLMWIVTSSHVVVSSLVEPICEAEW